MTEENYNYRTSQTLLRNQFPGKGKWKIPVIPKFQPKDGDFNDLLLIGFDKTNLEDQNHLDRMVHFFLYDYRFERVWKNPEADIEKLSRYRAVLSPDFSMYLEMAPAMQMYNVFRNRWCGAYWASKGIRVILAQFLIVQRMGNLTATALTGVIAVDGFLAQRRRQLFQRTGFLSTQKDGAVHVADNRIRAVFIQGFELALCLHCLLYTSPSPRD